MQLLSTTAAVTYESDAVLKPRAHAATSGDFCRRSPRVLAGLETSLGDWC
jgi:hypothetical protein